jgi:hypothetical protein
MIQKLAMDLAKAMPIDQPVIIKHKIIHRFSNKPTSYHK